MPNVPKLTKEQMFVILGAFAVVGILAALKVELTAFLAFAGLVLVGVGVIQQTSTKAEVTEVKANTNGTNTKLVAAVMVALAHTPASDADRILTMLTDAGVLPSQQPRELVTVPAVPAQRESVENVEFPA